MKFFRTKIPFELTESEEKELIQLYRIIVAQSQDRRLLTQRSYINRQGIDDYRGYLIHGVSSYDSKKFKGIVENGILSGDFLGIEEDGETFFHADFIKIRTSTISQWQNIINSASGKFGSKYFNFNGLTRYMPRIGDRHPKIAIIVDITNISAERISRALKINSKFITHFPLKFTDDSGPNMVSILGGVPTSNFAGVLINDLVNIEEIKNILADMYIPIFDVRGEQIY